MREFVVVRIVRMNDVDISLFQFDYDLTWAGMFLGPDERVYGRYGGRDAGDAEARLSVAGLKHTMREVLEYHRRQPAAKTVEARKAALAGDLFPRRPRGCLHCHQVWEGMRRQSRADGTFDAESLDVYPLPENVGLRLDLTAGNKITGITPDSPADRTGLRAGDLIETIHEIPIFSQGDVMWALHNAPIEGTTRIRYRRGQEAHTAVLQLTRGWKRTDLSWRPSLRRQRGFRAR